MKKTILSLFALPLFLTSCNVSSWYSVDEAKARDIANNIIQYNKQNRPRHLIMDKEEINYPFQGGKIYPTNIIMTHAMYDIDQWRCQIGKITIDPLRLDKTQISLTIFRVQNNTISSIKYEKDGEVHVSEIYYAKDNDEAKKIFIENIIEGKVKLCLEAQINPCLEITDLFEIEDYYHTAGKKLKNPSIDGSYEVTSKNNNSLSISSNYHSPISASKDGIAIENIDCSKIMLFDNNRCLKCQSSLLKPTTGRQFKTIAYDYDTPVKFNTNY